jgi:hypothetical protein
MPAAGCSALCRLPAERRSRGPAASFLHPPRDQVRVRVGRLEELGRSFGLFGVLGSPRGAEHDARGLVDGPLGRSREGDVARGVLGGVEPGK